MYIQYVVCVNLHICIYRFVFDRWQVLVSWISNFYTRQCQLCRAKSLLILRIPFCCLILCGQLVSSCQWISYATCLAPVNGPLSDLDVSVLLRYLNVSTLYNNVSEGVSLLFKSYDLREKEKHLFWWLLWGGCLVEDGDQPDIVESLWGTKACLHQSWQLVGMVMTA